MATSGHPSRLAAAAPSPPFSSSFSSNSSSTNQEDLSEAYAHYIIRSLVKKHLMMSSSSSPARYLHEDHHLNTMANTTRPHDHHRLQQEQAPVAMKPPAKKQARRRTHASRPYQERLLNMAEARREIVTALKIHRANMRHQHQQPCTYQHQADTLPRLRQPPLQFQQLQHQEQQRREQEVRVVFQDRSRQAVEEGEALLAAPASYASYSDHQLYCNPLAHWSSAAAPAGSCYSSPVLPYDLTPPLEAAMPTAMGGLEQLARSLPAQPLGLNLSFVQGFGGGFVDGARDCTEGFFGVPVTQSTSSPAASSYSAYSSPATEVASGAYGSPVMLSSTAEKYSPSVDAPAALVVAPVLDDGDTQSGGEAQGVEWCGDATAADVAAASAWWSKALLESMESGGGGEVVEGGSAVGCTTEDVAAAGLPPAEWRWLCDDDGVGAQGAVTGVDDDKPPDFIEMLADGDFYACCYDDGDRRCSDGGDGIALPCMDGIGDIEGSDVEWFS